MELDNKDPRAAEIDRGQKVPRNGELEQEIRK